MLTRRTALKAAAVLLAAPGAGTAAWIAPAGTAGTGFASGSGHCG